MAVVRAYRQAGALPQRDIVVGAFTNEEGVRYQPDMMGSLVSAGGMATREALDTIGIDGTRLGDELRAANKTLLASLLCLVVPLVLPTTQRLARTASLSFVSRS